MKNSMRILSICMMMWVGLASSVHATSAEEVAEQRAAVREKTKQILNDLYQAEPSPKKAAAKSGEAGAAYQGAISIWPGVWLYQLTDQGLALELTVKGTKYYKDDELN